MRDSDNQYEKFCKDEFLEINNKLDRLDVAIRGNGKVGIVTRLDRIEQTAKLQARILWVIVGTLATVTATSVASWITG